MPNSRLRLMIWYVNIVLPVVPVLLTVVASAASVHLL